MEEQWIKYIPLLSAGIGAIIAMLINQVMSHLRWREELKRKGEDKYLEKKLENLHDAIIEFFLMANKALELSRIVDVSKLKYAQDDIEKLDADIRGRIAQTAPYLERNLNQRVENLYEILTTMRLIIRKEIEGDDKEIVTNLLWLNEELHYMNDDLGNVMKEFHVKKEGFWIKWVAIISVLTNILLVVYIFSNN
ncbi:hypothetical protein OA45_00057 [Bacillus sp. UMTAT18]|uniref:hypothetical protein n=1 Tax=Bacillus TaxID=1386 RepID=UPI00061871E6|nr:MULTISPECIES: hypothetical protein [unclassified Bacillus (in: firmicutes)]KKC56422.1 hypothetical protein OA45_00057 [Bacillus sp. UMTAT18]OJD77556.1 hypothetical protein BAU29_18730 [Bacillus sp. P14-1]PEW06411.1 hypothetical protein CN428_04575 [Bacillus cereus]PFA30087.1 hypothetical protein CN390_21895 [Bacillus cereus]